MDTRKLDLLRISFTDLCNLRCIYCMPEGCQKLSHSDILRYEEIERLCRIVSQMGIHNFRATGGEPLVRRGITRFLQQFVKNDFVKNLYLTTNLSCSEEIIQTLNTVGLSGINVSIDSITEKTYEAITGMNKLAEIVQNIRKLRIPKIKTNTVILKDINHEEIQEIIEFAHSVNAVPRFIECMDVQYGRKWFVSAEEIIQKLMKRGFLKGKPFRDYPESPAVYYTCSNGLPVGFIMPETVPFCNVCSRLRLTADGKIRICLFSEKSLDVKKHIREGCSDEDIILEINKIVAQKGFRQESALIRPMSSIGG